MTARVTDVRVRRTNRSAQTGVFDLDIRISNRPSIDICKSFAAETGLKSRNVEKRINARLSGPNGKTRYVGAGNNRHPRVVFS
jgi:hypothetical protein